MGEGLRCQVRNALGRGVVVVEPLRRGRAGIYLLPDGSGGRLESGFDGGQSGRVDVRLACSSKGETEDGARVFAWVEGRRQPLHVQS